MEQEVINNVLLNDLGELFLSLESSGKAMYQHVYREAASVYWDQDNHGFKSTPIKDWSCSKWFSKIVSVVNSGLGVELCLSPNTTWQNIPENVITEIVQNHAT